MTLGKTFSIIFIIGFIGIGIFTHLSFSRVVVIHSYFDKTVKGAFYFALKRTSMTEKNLLELSDDEFMELQRRIQDERKQHLRSVCKQYHNGPPNPMAVLNNSRGAAEMLVDEKHKIVMCCTAKIAGKSWKRVFNVLTGLSNSTMEYDGYETVEIARNITRLKSYQPNELKNIFQNYTFFMFARNPLTRILSAFNNKLSPNSSDDRHRHIYWKMGQYMIKTYRPLSRAANSSNFTNYDLSFQDFVRYLADQKVGSSRVDNHWVENYKFCSACNVPYDVIGKYETLLDDAKYILKLTKVDQIVSFPNSEGTKVTSTFSSNPNKLWSFFKQVPLDDFTRLVDRYKMDFLLFNYSYPSLTNLFE